MSSNASLFVFSLALFGIGATLIGLVKSAQNSLSNACVSSNVLIGLNLILAIGVMLIVLPIISFFCYGWCKCPQNDLPYSWLIVFLLLSIAILSVVVLSGIKEANCDDSNTKNIMIAICIISTLISMGLIGFKIKSNIPVEDEAEENQLAIA